MSNMPTKTYQRECILTYSKWGKTQGYSRKSNIAFDVLKADFLVGRVFGGS